MRKLLNYKMIIPDCHGILVMVVVSAVSKQSCCCTQISVFGMSRTGSQRTNVNTSGIDPEIILFFYLYIERFLLASMVNIRRLMDILEFDTQLEHPSAWDTVGHRRGRQFSQKAFALQRIAILRQIPLGLFAVCRYTTLNREGSNQL